MGKPVTVYVNVTDPETGEVHFLKPGDSVPKGLEDLVGPHCFRDPDEDKVLDEPAGPNQTQVTRAEASRRSRERAKAIKAQEDADAEAEAKAKAEAEAKEAEEKAKAEAAAAGAGGQ